MSSQQYAIIDQNNIWQSTISWDGVTQLTPSTGWSIQTVASLPPGGIQGYALVNGVWVDPNAISNVPQIVSKAQFYVAAASSGIITFAEAEALLSNGTIPASLASAITTLPANQQSIARIAIVGVANYQRNDPFVSTLATEMGLTSTQLDSLFIAAGAIAL